MRKIKLYIAISLNGKIARQNGSVDWLERIPKPKTSDYGYKDFYDSIDTTIQGFNTYKQITGWDIPFPYSDKKNYVVTSKKQLSNNDNVDFITENHVNAIQTIKEEAGKDIWLIGGGETNTYFLNKGLLDEIHLFIMPVIIPDGINLFESIPIETKLELIESKSFNTGATASIYKVSK